MAEKKKRSGNITVDDSDGDEDNKEIIISDDDDVCDINDIEPTERDILCGRGKGTINWPGNVNFYKVLRANLEEYVMTQRRFEKSEIVSRIVWSIKEEGIRFLKKDSKSNKYHCISNQDAKTKTGHAIRDLVRNSDNESLTMMKEKKKGKRAGGGVGIQQRPPPTTIPKFTTAVSDESITAETEPSIRSMIKNMKKKKKCGTGINSRSSIKHPPKRNLAIATAFTTNKIAERSSQRSTRQVSYGSCTAVRDESSSSSHLPPSKRRVSSASSSSSTYYFDDDDDDENKTQDTKKKQKNHTAAVAQSSSNADDLFVDDGWSSSATNHTSGMMKLPPVPVAADLCKVVSATTFDDYTPVAVAKNIPSPNVKDAVAATSDQLDERMDPAGNEVQPHQGERGKARASSLLTPSQPSSSLPRRSTTVSPPVPLFPQEFSTWDFSIDNTTTTTNVAPIDVDMVKAKDIWDDEKLLFPVTSSAAEQPASSSTSSGAGGMMISNKELLQQVPIPSFPISFAMWDFSTTDNDDALVESSSSSKDQNHQQQQKQQFTTTAFVCS